MSSSSNATSQRQSLPLGALTALVVGSMIGGGVFSLPQAMSAGASSGAILIGWGITALGMLMLTFVFQSLANRQPGIVGGVYGYARAGFGNLLGFTSAWGYWVSALISNVFYLLTLMSALSYFFPGAHLGQGNTVTAIVLASAYLWLVHGLIVAGVKSAAIINEVATLAKMVPLGLFVVAVAMAFRMDTFQLDFWGTPNLGSVMDQVKACMAVTVFVFVGVEGASNYSSRAKKASDVGKATVYGFLFTLVIYMAVSMMSLGIVPQAQLAQMQNPSMAGVLEAALTTLFGHDAGVWGARLINLGLIISVMGAMLSWTLLAIELPFVGGRDRVFPSWFGKQNHQLTPINALWVTNLGVQALLLLSYFSTKAYETTLYLATSTMLLPYLLCGAYAWLSVHRGTGYAAGESRVKDTVIAVISVVYAVWLVYAAGPKYLLLTALLYTPGLAVFAWARREQRADLFTPVEMFLASCLVAACGLCTWMLLTGRMSVT